MTISGVNLLRSHDSMADLTRIDVAGVSQALGGHVQVANETTIVFTMSAAPASCNGVIDVYSSSYGHMTSAAVYTYLPQGVISTVTPSKTHYDKSIEVTIDASSPISSGEVNDIVSVSLAGIPAKVISVSELKVVVQAQPIDKPKSGDVVVISKVYGTTSKKNAFSYEGAAPAKDKSMSGWTIFAIAFGGAACAGALAGGIMFAVKKNKKKEGILLMDETGDAGSSSTTDYGALTTNA